MSPPPLPPHRPPPQIAKKKPSPQQYLGTAVGIVVGGFIGFCAIHFGFELLAPVPNKLLKLISIAALPLIWLGVVGFHEFGHLAGGWITGGRFLLWMAGPFMIRRTPAGVRFALNRTINVTGGLAACLPLDPAKVTPRRAAVMILGGPVSSLALTALMLWLAAACADVDGPIPGYRAILQHIALFTAGLSFLIFVVTLLPGTAAGFKTDGKRAYELLRRDHRSDQEAAVLVLTTAALGGVRPADYDPEIVRRALALDDGSLFDLYARLTVFYHAADLGNYVEARTHLDRVIAGSARLAPHVRDAAYLEYAWLLATCQPDAALARMWLNAAPGGTSFEPATRLRAEAAVLLAEGKHREAADKAREGLHALEHKSLSPVKSAFASDVLEDILRRAQAAGQSARPLIASDTGN